MLRSFSYQVCLMGFLGRVKPTDKRRNTICADASAPALAAFQFRYAKQLARFITRMRAFLILNVSRSRYISKIVKRIISRVAVNVVNIIKRPIFSNVKPSQSTGYVPFFVYSDYCVPFGLNVARNRPRNNFSACFYFPRKNAGFGVVVQQCTQLVECDVRVRHATSIS